MAFSVGSNKGVNQESPQTARGESQKSGTEPRVYQPANQADKTVEEGKSYNLLYELMKVMAAISLLVSILVTVAMLADLYFKDAFLYFNRAFWGQTYISGDTTDEKSTVAEIPVFEIFDDQPDPKREDTPQTNRYKKDEREKYEEDEWSEPNKIERSDPISPAAARSDKRGDTPRVAIIIDDMGFDLKMADALSRIEINLTISILPGSPFGRQIAKKLHSKGMEIMLHLPMEPLQYPSVDPGYGAILSGMKPDNMIKVLNMNLDGLPHVSGVNNHMGSKLTAISPAMRQIFTVLKKRGLFFVDSLTSNSSSGRKAAELIQLPFASRNLFLDNNKDIDYIKRQLKELVRIAKKSGAAIAIGHPYKETFIALKEEIPALKKSVKIVPVSQLVMP